jgi:hypothetical protein
MPNLLELVPQIQTIPDNTADRYESYAHAKKDYIFPFHFVKWKIVSVWPAKAYRITLFPAGMTKAMGYSGQAAVVFLSDALRENDSLF